MESQKDINKAYDLSSEEGRQSDDEDFADGEESGGEEDDDDDLEAHFNNGARHQ
jgi:hypothetical protein